MVSFAGAEHQAFTAKITTATGKEVWNPGLQTGNSTGAACATMLTPGVSYRAYAQVNNPAGASAWSAPVSFQVTRTGETTDARDMSENNLMAIDTVPPARSPQP